MSWKICAFVCRCIECCTGNIFNNDRCSAFISNRYLLSIQVSKVSLLSLYSYFMCRFECNRLDSLWCCTSSWEEMRSGRMSTIRRLALLSVQAKYCFGYLRVNWEQASMHMLFIFWHNYRKHPQLIPPIMAA